MAKGQITIFIVLGILILIGVGLLVYVLMLNEGVDVSSSQEARNSLEVYVDSCHERAIQEGLEIMRMQGGVIQIPLGARTVDVFDSQTIIDTPQGKRLVARVGENKIVYWKDETGYIAFPSFIQMQEELSNYVESYVFECVNSFEPFREDGYAVEQGEVVSEVAFGSSVVSTLNFPITLTKGEEVLSREAFSYAIPIDMERIYTNAYLLMQAQEVDSFLEHHISKLISLYGYGGKTQNPDIPPFSFSAFDTSCDEKEWQLPLVKTQLSNLLEENIPLLQIGRTNIKRYSFSEDGSCQGNSCVSQGVLDGFILDYLPEDDQIHVEFSLVDDSEETFYDIRPRSGNTIKGDTTQFPPIFMASSTCYSRFFFKYTVNAPILVEIEDEWSNRAPIAVGAPEKNFTFRYVIGTNLCGNQEGGCNYPQDPLYFTAATSSFCQNASAGPLQIDVFNARNFQPISDVRVTYTCGAEVNTCAIGKTNSEGEIKDAFPYCLNGILVTEKEGFEEKFSLLSTDFNPAHYEVRMYPTQELSTNFVLVHMPTFLKNYHLTDGYRVNACDGRSAQSLLEETKRDLSGSEYEQVIGSLQNGVNKNPQVIAPYDLKINPNPSIELSPGIYDVSLSYVATGVIVEDSSIEGTKISYGSDSGPQNVPLGNIDFSFEPQGIYDSSQITFFIPVEGFKDETFNTKQLVLNPIHQSGGFESRFDFAENSIPALDCANEALSGRVSIRESDFIEIMEPELK